MSTRPEEQGLGGTAAGPGAVRDAELADKAEEIAVPTFDVVTVPVESTVEPAADAMPDADEPDADEPDAEEPDADQ